MTPDDLIYLPHTDGRRVRVSRAALDDGDRYLELHDAAGRETGEHVHRDSLERVDTAAADLAEAESFLAGLGGL